MAGESLVYECKEGYETSKRTARDQIVCNGNQWNPMPECSCKLIKHCYCLIVQDSQTDFLCMDASG